MAKARNKHSSWVHLRSLDPDKIEVPTLCGKTSVSVRSTFKRSSCTCPKCNDIYKMRGQR